MKRMLCAVLALLLLAGLVPAALAEQPRPITPLDYDTLPAALEGQHHYLLACVDNWQGNASNLGNTDGMMMVTFDTRAKRLLFTTYMREMLIQRPDGGIGRLTYIGKNYGLDALARTISTHFGVKVDKYIIFSMDNVQTIIDALGGVYITVTQEEANYLNRYRISRDSTKPSMENAGTYLFGGHAAVIYMRIRKVGRDGDAGRTRRMRTVLATLAKNYDKVTLSQALDILESVTKNQVATNMSLSDMMEAVGYAMQVAGAEPEGLQMPSNDAMEPITYAGMSTRQVDFERCRALLQEFLDNSFVVVDE
ncbi:MAG: LCP family protein [Candidatus Limiplasma sp.]|nr:LCP family protein [Candidatus Limiplasma sp.]MEA5146651.1 LCP family protein [Candidatus Limiplasma sp.]